MMSPNRQCPKIPLMKLDNLIVDITFLSYLGDKTVNFVLIDPQTNGDIGETSKRPWVSKMRLEHLIDYREAEIKIML